MAVQCHAHRNVRLMVILALALSDYSHSNDRWRYWRGTKETRHPPGRGVILKSLGDVRRWSGSTRLISSGVGSSRSSRRGGVGGTAGTGLVALGSRVLTAARSGSPYGTTAPHAAHVLPPRFSPSQTGHRQIALILEVDHYVFGRAFRLDDPQGAAR